MILLNTDSKEFGGKNMSGFDFVKEKIADFVKDKISDAINGALKIGNECNLLNNYDKDSFYLGLDTIKKAKSTLSKSNVNSLKEQEKQKFLKCKKQILIILKKIEEYIKFILTKEAESLGVLQNFLRFLGFSRGTRELYKENKQILFLAEIVKSAEIYSNAKNTGIGMHNDELLEINEYEDFLKKFKKKTVNEIKGFYERTEYKDIYARLENLNNLINEFNAVQERGISLEEEKSIRARSELDALKLKAEKMKTEREPIKRELENKKREEERKIESLKKKYKAACYMAKRAKKMDDSFSPLEDKDILEQFRIENFRQIIKNAKVEGGEGQAKKVLQDYVDSAKKIIQEYNKLEKNLEIIEAELKGEDFDILGKDKRIIASNLIIEYIEEGKVKFHPVDGPLIKRYFDVEESYIERLLREVSEKKDSKVMKIEIMDIYKKKFSELEKIENSGRIIECLNKIKEDMKKQADEMKLNMQRRDKDVIFSQSLLFKSDLIERDGSLKEDKIKKIKNDIEKLKKLQKTNDYEKKTENYWKTRVNKTEEVKNKICDCLERCRTSVNGAYPENDSKEELPKTSTVSAGQALKTISYFAKNTRENIEKLIIFKADSKGTMRVKISLALESGLKKDTEKFYRQKNTK